ncbi:MAG: hypothetical protein IT198_05005 [Acidimicrobiia bacterium]|nr:hypothetical protein [Acidimicrobiia bacterium]
MQMRIAFAFEPATGHLLPAVPFARELRRRGHAVWVLTDATGRTIARRAGLPTAHPNAGRPHVIVRDQAERLSPPLCAAEGIPAVTMSFGITQDDAPRVATERLHVCFAPASYAGRVESRVPVVHARPPTVNPDASGRNAAPDRVTVYATLGSIHGETPGWFEAVLSGLEDLDAEVVCSIGTRDAATLDPVPANATLHARVDQPALLRRCRLMLSHGGVAGIMEALAAGVPLLLTPLAGDHFAHADRCAALGVGRRLELEAVTPAGVHAAVVSALADRRLHTGARRIGTDIRTLPGPDHVADLVEAAAV